MADIFQLTDWQNKQLAHSANTEEQIILVLEPNETDDPETAEKLTTEIREIEELEQLGLVQAKTGKFLNMITAYKVKANRGMRIYIMTTLGFDMFNGPSKRTVQ